MTDEDRTGTEGSVVARAKCVIVSALLSTPSATVAPPLRTSEPTLWPWPTGARGDRCAGAHFLRPRSSLTRHPTSRASTQLQLSSPLPARPKLKPPVRAYPPPSGPSVCRLWLVRRNSISPSPPYLLTDCVPRPVLRFSYCPVLGKLALFALSPPPSHLDPNWLPAENVCQGPPRCAIQQSQRKWLRQSLLTQPVAMSNGPSAATDQALSEPQVRNMPSVHIRRTGIAFRHRVEHKNHIRSIYHSSSTASPVQNTPHSTTLRTCQPLPSSTTFIESLKAIAPPILVQ